MLNGLSLFSGIGGIDVALSGWVRPIAYCEIDPYCQGVLLSRMSSFHIANAPIWDDITTFPTSEFEVLRGFVDIIYGGFPCQDISVAGNGKGLAGERSGLFYEIVRLCREIKPRFIFLENVPAITTRGGVEVVREITALGYDCRWCVISAASVGALHKRERWFLLANTKRKRRIQPELEERSRCEKRLFEGNSTNSADVANSNGEGCNQEQRGESERLSQEYAEPSNCDIKDGGNTLCEPGEQTHSGAESEQTERNTWGRPTGQYWPFESREHWQEVVSSMGKSTDGLPDHVARLRSLGNAVVPAQVKEAFKILMGIKE